MMMMVITRTALLVECLRFRRNDLMAQISDDSAKGGSGYLIAPGASCLLALLLERATVLAILLQPLECKAIQGWCSRKIGSARPRYGWSDE
jgi:hypothetical protein